MTRSADRRPERRGAAETPVADTQAVFDNPRWLVLLDGLTIRGADGARMDTLPPTDEDLWAGARLVFGTGLPDLVDTDMLAELRGAYNAGRQPTRINLKAVADSIEGHGYRARVEHTGGNTATLYGGHLFPDRFGEPRWSVAAGPGWFEAPGRHRPFADTDEFHAGPDSDDGWVVAVPEYTTTRQVTDLIVAVIEFVEARRARFVEAADAAREAMWATFAQRYPEVTTGDLPPGADYEFVVVSNKVLAGWLDDNWADTRVAPTHLTRPDAGAPAPSSP